jgi:hypothetical protein
MRPVARSGEEDGRDPDVDEAEFVAESIKRNTIRLFFILLSQLSRIDLHIQMCEEVFPSDWWTGTYLEGLTLPRDLRQRGTLGGPQKKKKKSQRPKGQFLNGFYVNGKDKCKM